LLLQDHLTMSLCHVKQQEMIFKTGKFSVPAKMRQSMKQTGLAVAEFQARAAATRKTRSPIVVWHVDGTSREVD